MSIQQLQTVKQGGPFALVTTPIPKPSSHEVCIRPRAVALNPIDWKNLCFSAAIQSWPHVLGIEGAGIVESVGDGVTSFRPGDEVTSVVETRLSEGVFRDVFTAPETAVMKKTAFLSFEEAATLPISYATAAATVTIGLKVPLPGLSKKETPNNPPRSILILGCGSGVGAAAVQLLRMALPSATIITTSSPAHHAHLKSLGASVCLERAAQQDVNSLRAATSGREGVDAIIDTVGAGVEEPGVLEALKSDGPKLHCAVVTHPNQTLPAGLQASLVGGHDFLGKEPRAMQYLKKLLEEGKYKLPLKVEVVGEGLQAIEKSLDRFPEVSGTKLVVRL